MPRTRSCKDLSVEVQSKIPFQARKTRHSISTNNKNKLQEPVVLISDSTEKCITLGKRILRKKENNADIHVVSSPLKISQLNSPLKSPFKSPFKDCTNTFNNVNSPGKRKLFGDKENVSPKKVSKFNLETGNAKGAIKNIKITTPNRRTPIKKDSTYTNILKSLHTSIPKQLVSRQEEFSLIKKFVEKTIVQGELGSMYMSGAPGTGKTACLTKVLEEFKECKKLQSVFLNCMSLKFSQSIFTKLALEFSATPKQQSAKDSIKFLEKKFTSSGPRILLILDEIDQLESKNQDVLYKLFEMPFLAKSRLVLIGIANALDLTDRVLPRLQAKSTCKPVLLQFPPYTKDEILSILQERVKETGSTLIDAPALLFCARKVSAMSGDVRKALDILRRAVERCSEQDLQKKNCENVEHKRVTVANIASVCAEVYGSKISSSSGIKNGFPLQQKIVVCTLMLLLKDKKMKECTISKLYESYCRICTSSHITTVSQEEINGVCSLLEAQGIIAFKKSKDGRNGKISLRLQENELEHALQDKTLVSSILNAGLPSS